MAFQAIRRLNCDLAWNVSRLFWEVEYDKLAISEAQQPGHQGQD